jgi:thiamine-monophosphate kinase
LKERALIDWIRSQEQWDRQDILVGPGDDCAVLAGSEGPLVVTVDQLMDGVHFDSRKHAPRMIGRKAMARNLSDIAAMAARPLWAVGTLAMPRTMRDEDVREIHRGRKELSDQFNCPVVGGDVGSWDSPLLITLTVFGRVTSRGPVLRSGARPGDVLCVTGRLGGAWRDEKHLTFTPRVAEALALHEQFDLSAMIDLSDGLSTDLSHICKASGCGAEIQADQLPLRLSGGGQVDPLQAALNDGEDYELLFALPAQAADKLLSAQPLDVPITRIGRCTEDKQIFLVGPEGDRTPLASGGWEHQTTDHES